MQEAAPATFSLSFLASRHQSLIIIIVTIMIITLIILVFRSSRSSRWPFMGCWICAGPVKSYRGSGQPSVCKWVAEKMLLSLHICLWWLRMRYIFAHAVGKTTTWSTLSCPLATAGCRVSELEETLAMTGSTLQIRTQRSREVLTYLKPDNSGMRERGLDPWISWVQVQQTSWYISLFLLNNIPGYSKAS